MRDPLRDAFDRYRSGAPLMADARFLVRWGLGFVFLWFGIDKFVHPAYWPMWIPATLPMLGTPGAIAGFGIFEILVGLALVSNVRVRETSAIASLFLTGIIATAGITAVVRDVGLLAAALYLALTTSGSVSTRSPDSTVAEGAARWNLSAPKRALIGAGMGILLLGGVIAAGVDIARPGPSSVVTDPLLVIETPQADSELQAGNLPVRVRVNTGLDGPLANHVHFKVDGQVMDAVYLRQGEFSASTVLKGLTPGAHDIEVYLAYSDHTEYPGSRAIVTVTLRP